MRKKKSNESQVSLFFDVILFSNSYFRNLIMKCQAFPFVLLLKVTEDLQFFVVFGCEKEQNRLFRLNKN